MKFLRHLAIALLTATFALSLARAGHAETYTIDNSHSSIAFRVKHLLVSETRGEFTDYTGRIDFDAASAGETEVDVVIQATSIDTRNAQRDNHLRTPDFFDVPKFPVITFKSTNVTKKDEQYFITGNLTLRGVTRKVTIPVSIYGPVQSPFGSQVIGISGTTMINRQDFGISWNKKMDHGGFVVGDDVIIEVNIEAHAS